MNKQDVSVEYCHIYTNNKINEEHELSLKILGEVKKQLEESSQTFSLVTLVDDYSFPDPTFNYDELFSWLKEKGFSPDLILRESQLIPLCDEVLNKINDMKLKNQLVDYIKTKKYPCSLFIAAWYLLRLGHLKHDSFDEELYADKLINILPESFKPFEDLGLEIIAKSDFAGAEKQIVYRFLEGRLIA